MPDEPSWQELIHRHQAREFVGRDQELAWFRGNLALPLAERRFVVNIHGDAGVGKSFLLEELRRIAADTAGAATARVAEDCRSLLDVWEALGTQLVEQGCLPRSFPQRVAAVAQQLRAAAAPDGGAADEPSPAGRLAAGVGVAAVQALPVVGPFAGLISPDQVAQGAHQLGTAVGRRLRNPSADGHGTDEDQLSRAFVEGLRAAGGRPLLLCFDTYERLEPVADQWLRDLVHGRYGRVPATVMLVVSGQRPLRADRWAPLLPVTAAMRLRVFTQEETREYLANRGITDPEVVRVVEGLSGRLPVLVATLARTRPAGVEEVGDPSGDAVERFLRWEPDPQRRDFAVRSALPRTLDGDVLELLAGPRDDGRLGAWLRSMPFIQDQGRVLRFHEVVRTAMLRYQHNLAPRRWAALHRELAAGFGRWRQEADAGADEGHGDDWWQLRREEYYHLLCADGERRLTEALNEAADGGSVGPVSARAWAEVLRDAGRDGEHPALLAWGARLSTVLDAPADDPSGYLTLLIDFAALQPAVRARALAARARHHFAFDRETQAAADCDHALRLSPDDPALLVERARIHRWEGEFDQALDCLARALERQPGSAAGRTLRGWVLLDAGRSEEAAQTFAAVLETTPQNESARLGLCFTAHRRGDHEEALRQCATALDWDPESPWALATRAELLLAADRREEAGAAAERALAATEPGDIAFVRICADVLFALGRVEDALAAGERGLAQARNRPYAHDWYAWLLWNAGRRDQAVAVVDTALALHPAHSELHGSRGAFLRALERYEEALESLDRALRMRPGSAWTLTERARCRAALEQHAAALEDHLAVAGMQPDNPWPHSEAGFCAHRLGRHEEAVRHYDRAIALGLRGETWPVARRGWSLHCLGREDEALAALDEALSGPEPWWYAFSMRGWLRWQRGDPVEAEADFDRAIAGTPPDAGPSEAWAWMGRGVVRAYRGRHDQARADLREALARGAANELPMAQQLGDDLAELIRVHLGRDRAAVTEGLRSFSILSRQARWPGLQEHVGAFLAHRPSPRLLLAVLTVARRANAELRAYRGRHQRSAALLVEEISRGLRLLQAAAPRQASGPPPPPGNPDPAP